VSSPDQMNINFRQSNIDYYISLIKGYKSENSFKINGIIYAVLGGKEKLKTACDILNSISLDNIANSQDLTGRLSTRSDLLFQTENISMVGVNILETSNLTKNEEKQAKVLNELSPTWRTPGAALESITDRMKDLAVAGARITVIDKGSLWSAGFGKLENPNLIIQAASISKTITALTILSFIEDKILIPKSHNLLTLDTDIKDILDEDLWKSISNDQKEPITIRQLMAHTAGLEGESHTGFRGYYRDKNSEIRETIDQISRLRDQLQEGPNKKIEKQIVNLELSLSRAEERAEKQQLPTVDETYRARYNSHRR